MANTYTQIHIHAVFAVQNRLSLIQDKWKTDLYKYITGIIQNNSHKVLIINGMSDHIHILFGLRPVQSIADLMQDIKGSSSKWINEMNFIRGKFAWQEGYGAFSCNKSNLDNLIRYIENQEIHHRKQTFIDEYKEYLRLHEITFDEKYIFKQPI
jgi:putative transposase